MIWKMKAYAGRYVDGIVEEMHGLLEAEALGLKSVQVDGDHVVVEVEVKEPKADGMLEAIDIGRELATRIDTTWLGWVPVERRESE